MLGPCFLRQAAEFAEAHLWDEASGRLRRSFRLGPSAVAGFADDYANMVAGLLDLYAASGDVRWLRWALRLQRTMDDLFWDDVAGGWGLFFGGGGAFHSPTRCGASPACIPE
jgi:uncharacterized protein